MRSSGRPTPNSERAHSFGGLDGLSRSGARLKTVGVLGFGPQATIDFEQRFHLEAQRQGPQDFLSGYPPLVVYHCRHAPMERSSDGRPVSPARPDPRLLEAASRLGDRCDFLVITANFPHLFQAQIESASGKPVLSMIDLALREVERRTWTRVGVLGMGEPQVYTARMAAAGIHYDVIASGLQSPLDQAIREVMEGRNDRNSTAVALQAVAELRARPVDGIVLGCTEIPLLLREAALSPDLLDPLGLLARAAVQEAMV
jgi:aspartate racemase